ncbi:MAG TPA: hypothetical protein VEZ12_13310 [Herpetosiphonaceae bacterium]|nr:hypothetical protein [Herpetosiphonaceae bacterium]
MSSNQNSLGSLNLVGERPIRKIAYTLHWDQAWGRGVIKKILGQTGVWLDSGYDARIFMLSPQENAAEIAAAIDATVPVTTRSYQGIAGRFVQYHPLTHLVDAWKPDMVYLRYSGAYPALVGLTRRIPSIYEINTDDLTDFQVERSYRGWYNRLTRGCLLSEARGMIFVSGEVARKPQFTCFGKPTIVIGNGIDLSAYEQLPAPLNPHPRLVFLAGSPEEPWQGIDKVSVLAEHVPAWEFDLIGVTQEQLGESVPANIRAHGFLDRSQYESILAQADVAISQLALHRKKMDENSTLKVLEYLAFGLPTIVAYTETDLPPPQPYILQLPNTPDNIVPYLATIRQFVEQMQGRRVPREHILHLDVRRKEHQRLEFFSRVLSAAH